MNDSSPSLLVKPIHLVPSQGRASSPLSARLRKELRGDVLFDRASRGRYATDASIYQIMPVGVVVPRDQADLMLALEIARDEKAPVLAQRRGHQPVRPDRWRGAGDRQQQVA
ncbi:hypothetical protein ACU4GD_21165 [Cupriavidus basilensis]